MKLVVDVMLGSDPGNIEGWQREINLMQIQKGINGDDQSLVTVMTL